MIINSDNKVAIYNVLKGLLVAGGPVAVLLVNTLHLDNDTAQAIIQLISPLLTIVGLIWLGISGTDRNVAINASLIRGVQVHASPLFAPEAVVEVAKNRDDITDVVPMVGGPRTDKGG
jgi:hypothetical protein